MRRPSCGSLPVGGYPSKIKALIEKDDLIKIDVAPPL